jgi:hypothetical protein
VGWILEADAQRSVSALGAALAPAPPSISALIVRLKSQDRSAHGVKQDQIAYEAIADVIGANDACCRRARELLNAMTDVLLGRNSERFTAAPNVSSKIWVLQP